MMGRQLAENQAKKKYLFKIISLLLTKYERSQAFFTGEESKQRPQFALKNCNLSDDYFDEMDFRKREWINEVLVELEQQGIIKLKWVRLKNEQEVEKVYLNREALAQAYSLAGMKPKFEKIAAMRKILEPLSVHPWSWVQKWWQEIERQLAERKTGGLNLDDHDVFRLLVKVLLALPQIQDTMPKRTFSQKVLNDTKAFEQLVEGRLLSILKKHGENEYEKDQEYLDSIGLVDHPKIILLRGKITFSGNGIDTNIGGCLGGVGLSSETVKLMELKDVVADVVITVENLTSYYHLVNCIEQFPQAKECLVIYTGGFPHKLLQLFLRKLAARLNTFSLESTPAFYHWGDIDYGGIRIFQYIKENIFPDVKPYLMDVAIYKAQLDGGTSFDNEYAKKLENLAKNKSLTAWRSLIEEMLKHRVRIEQESITEKETLLKFFN